MPIEKINNMKTQIASASEQQKVKD